MSADCALYPLLFDRAIRRARAVPAAAARAARRARRARRELVARARTQRVRLVPAAGGGSAHGRCNVLGTSVVGLGTVAFMFLVSSPLLAARPRARVVRSAPHSAARAFGCRSRPRPLSRPHARRGRPSHQGASASRGRHASHRQAATQATRRRRSARTWPARTSSTGSRSR